MTILLITFLFFWAVYNTLIFSIGLTITVLTNLLKLCIIICSAASVIVFYLLFGTSKISVMSYQYLVNRFYATYDNSYPQSRSINYFPELPDFEKEDWDGNGTNRVLITETTFSPNRPLSLSPISSPVASTSVSTTDSVLSTMSWDKIYRANEHYRVPQDRQLNSSLKYLAAENYRHAFRKCLPALPENWQKLSVRKLQKICGDINRVKPNTISGHYSRKVNKRLLVSKLKQVYC